MDLTILQSEVKKWGAYNFPNAKPHEPLLGALEELGELSHAHLKMEQGIRGDSQKHHAAKIDAVADIIIYLAHYCALNNIELGTAVSLTWSQVKQLDWQKDPEKGGIGGPA